MTITVTQLNNYIHGVFEIDGVLSAVSVCGEVTNLKQSREGWYFSLKDEQSSLNCFCYGNTATPVAGDMAVAEGQVNYFTRNGSVSLFVRRLTSTKNTGAAYLKFVELKEKLKKEGLFDEERKKPIPAFCEKIGVVTSETGAVIHDITNVALRRQPFVDIILCPVKVQGTGAASEIAEGIRRFEHTDVDVVIVGRGGGSNEDLSAFNDEEVVRAIAASVKPIVSAVGHGVDFTLSDFAADKRAVTPSEAAEFVTIDAEATIRRINAILERMGATLSADLTKRYSEVEISLKNIHSNAIFALEKAKNNVKETTSRIGRAVAEKLAQNEHRAQTAIAKVNGLSPLSVLQRGYAYVNGADGAVVRSVDDVNCGDKLTLTLCDGNVTAEALTKEKTVV